MASNILDARGLSCPQPAMLTREYLKNLSGHQAEILVDSGTARDNCTRIAERAGWRVTLAEQPDGVFQLLLEK